MRIPYATIRPRLQTGAVMLCSGNSGFSQQIKRWQRSKWSHVGIVVRRGEDLFIWESCSKVELVRFDDYFVTPSRYKASEDTGDVAIRELFTPDWFDRVGMQERLEAFIKDASGRAYETNQRELVLALLGEWGNREEALDEYFCSELAAESYQRMWLLPTDSGVIGYQPSNSFRPKDFTREMFLLNGCKLGPETLLKEKCV